MSSIESEKPVSSQSQTNKKSLTLFEVMQSILAAAFGVQSSKKRELDIRHGKPITFVIAGIIFVLVLILILVGIVKLVLGNL
ncbi:DUF2970 domain-containing protein [Pseudomonadota bacterium]